MYTPKTMSVDIPAELAPFVERLIAERRFLTESEVLAEGLRLLQSQEALRAAVRQGFAQLDEGKSAAADTVFAKAEDRIAAIERAGRAGAGRGFPRMPRPICSPSWNSSRRITPTPRVNGCGRFASVATSWHSNR